MSRSLVWILVALGFITPVAAQCENEITALLSAEQMHLLAASQAQKTALAVSLYEPLVEAQPSLEPVLATAREQRDLADANLITATADVASARAALEGCEESVAQQMEEEQADLEAISQSLLAITYYGPEESKTFTREEARRRAAAGRSDDVISLTTPIEITIEGKAGFSYELQRSSNLIDWHSYQSVSKLSEDQPLTWPITPTLGGRSRGDVVGGSGTDQGIPFFRIAVSTNDTVEDGVTRPSRSR